jgi:hypothetical protein
MVDLMTWAIGKPPLRAFGSGGVNLFKDVPPGRATMDNYVVVYESANRERFPWLMVTVSLSESGKSKPLLAAAILLTQ